MVNLFCFKIISIKKTQYNSLNVKLFNSQLNRVESGIKNGTEVTLNLSSNIIGDSINEINFPHKLLLTDTQVSKLRQAFANNSSANIKISKTHMSKIVQPERFLDILLGLLLKSGLPSMKNVIKPLATSVLIS